MKKILRILLVVLCATGLLQSCSVIRNPLKIKNYVEIETTEGNFVVGLYQGTPKHRDNFIDRCTSQSYNSTVLYKSVRKSEYSFGLRKGFEEGSVMQTDLVNDAVVPPEFNSKIIPKRGTVAMKRLVDAQNPDKKSDASLFFIVDGGKKITANEIKIAVALKNRDTYKIYIDEFLSHPENKSLKDSLDALRSMKTMKQYNEIYARVMEMVKPQIEKDGVKLFSVSEKNIEKYLETGGVPMFEGVYTVFGEIVVGLEMLEKFSKLETSLDYTPKKDVSIVSTVVLKKKDFNKKYKHIGNE